MSSTTVTPRAGATSELRETSLAGDEVDGPGARPMPAAGAPAPHRCSRCGHAEDDGSTVTLRSVAGDRGPTRLYNWLAFNRTFVATKQYEAVKRGGPVPKHHRKAVIVTCMDTRLVCLLPHALNLREGDAKLIKNAGAVITHPFGGIMRSIIVALYELSADEVFVIGHKDCGMSKIAPAATLDKMLAHGISFDTIETLESAGINIKRWLHGFDSVHESVRNSVNIIRHHPLVPPTVAVHGLLIDPDTGELELIVDGNLELEELKAMRPNRFNRAGSVTASECTDGVGHAGGVDGASATITSMSEESHGLPAVMPGVPGSPHWLTAHEAAEFHDKMAAAEGAASTVASVPACVTGACGGACDPDAESMHLPLPVAAPLASLNKGRRNSLAGNGTCITLFSAS